LSYDEIFKLAKICLKKFVTDEGDQFLDDLCEYFTRLIFSSVDISQDEEIPLQAIKEAIISVYHLFDIILIETFREMLNLIYWQCFVVLIFNIILNHSFFTLLFIEVSVLFLLL